VLFEIVATSSLGDYRIDIPFEEGTHPSTRREGTSDGYEIPASSKGTWSGEHWCCETRSTSRLRRCSRKPRGKHSRSE